MPNPDSAPDASRALSEETSRDGGPVAASSTGPDHEQKGPEQKGPSPLGDLAVNIQGTLARDLIKTGELEKRASVMGLGNGGGIQAWKRMTMGIIWDADGLKEDEDEEEEGVSPEEVEARKAKARAAAMAKLMGDTSVSSAVPATIAEEDEECDEPKHV